MIIFFATEEGFETKIEISFELEYTQGALPPNFDGTRRLVSEIAKLEIRHSSGLPRHHMKESAVGSGISYEELMRENAELEAEINKNTHKLKKIPLENQARPLDGEDAVATFRVVGYSTFTDRAAITSTSRIFRLFTIIFVVSFVLFIIGYCMGKANKIEMRRGNNKNNNNPKTSLLFKPQNAYTNYQFTEDMNYGYKK